MILPDSIQIRGLAFRVTVFRHSVYLVSEAEGYVATGADLLDSLELAFFRAWRGCSIVRGDP